MTASDLRPGDVVTVGGLSTGAVFDFPLADPPVVRVERLTRVNAGRIVWPLAAVIRVVRDGVAIYPARDALPEPIGDPEGEEAGLVHVPYGSPGWWEALAAYATRPLWSYRTFDVLALGEAHIFRAPWPHECGAKDKWPDARVWRSPGPGVWWYDMAGKEAVS